MMNQQKTIVLTHKNERYECRKNQQGEWHKNGELVTDLNLIEELNRTSITSSANTIKIGDISFDAKVHYGPL